MPTDSMKSVIPCLNANVHTYVYAYAREMPYPLSIIHVTDIAIQVKLPMNSVAVPCYAMPISSARKKCRRMPKNAEASTEGYAKGEDVDTEVMKQVLKRVVVVHGRSRKDEVVTMSKLLFAIARCVACAVFLSLAEAGDDVWSSTKRSS
jgi:CxxC motif-containing protein (DUF1111 family)